MADKGKTLISDSMVEKIIETIKTISNDAIKSSRELDLWKFEAERDQEQAKENKWRDEEEIIKKEFHRIGEKLSKTEPGTSEYDTLLDNLYNLKRCFGKVY